MRIIRAVETALRWLRSATSAATRIRNPNTIVHFIVFFFDNTPITTAAAV
jgi:hypothetical protein